MADKKYEGLKKEVLSAFEAMRKAGGKGTEEHGAWLRKKEELTKLREEKEKIKEVKGEEKVEKEKIKEIKEEESSRNKLRKSWKDTIMGGAGKGAGIARAEVPNIILVMMLIGIGFLDYLAKSAVGFEPVTSGIFSVITFVFFVWILRGQGRFKLLLGILIIDIFAITLILRYAPTNPLFPYLILFKTFIWIAAAIIAFLDVLFSYMNMQRHIPVIVRFVMIIFVIFLIVFGWPFAAKAFATESATHQIRHAEAFEKASEIRIKASEAVAKQINASSGFWSRWAKAVPYLLAGDVKSYHATLNPQKVEIKGEVDAAIKEYTKVEFRKLSSKDFSGEIEEIFPNPIPIYLDVDSPQKEIKITLSCSFKDMYGTEIAGKIMPPETYSIKGPKILSVLCKSENGVFIPGKYKAIFEARIEGLSTNSTLTRLFVGNMSFMKKEEERIAQGLNSREVSKISDEPVVFSFGIGTPLTNSLVDEQPQQPIFGNIENRHDGIITAIHSIRIDSVAFAEGMYIIDCPDFEMQADSLVFTKAEEIKQEQVNLERIKKGDKLFLLGCYLDIPESLRNIGDMPKKRTFYSHIDYSYKIKKEVPFVVKAAFKLET